jgi:hypothetical protein
MFDTVVKKADEFDYFNQINQIEKNTVSAKTNTVSFPTVKVKKSVIRKRILKRNTPVYTNFVETVPAVSDISSELLQEIDVFIKVTEETKLSLRDVHSVINAYVKNKKEIIYHT